MEDPDGGTLTGRHHHFALSVDTIGFGVAPGRGRLMELIEARRKLGEAEFPGGTGLRRAHSDERCAIPLAQL